MNGNPSGTGQIKIEVIRAGFIRGVGHDPLREILRVEINGKDGRMLGKIYEFAGVSAAVHRELMESHDPADYFERKIKPHYLSHVLRS